MREDYPSPLEESILILALMGPPSPFGRKRSLLPAHSRLRHLLFMQFGDLFVKSLSHRAPLPGMADEPHEREEAIRFAVFGLAIGEAG